METIQEQVRSGEITQRVVNSSQTNFHIVDKVVALKGIISLIDTRRVMLEKDIRGLLVAKDLGTLDVF